VRQTIEERIQEMLAQYHLRHHQEGEENLLTIQVRKPWVLAQNHLRHYQEGEENLLTIQVRKPEVLAQYHLRHLCSTSRRGRTVLTIQVKKT
jgi:hypothetical protein